MRTIMLIVVILAIFASTVQAQKPYSMEQLRKATPEELDVYLIKSLKLQQNGKTLNIIGGAILGATALSSVALADQLELGVVILAFFGGVAGLGTMAVGVPMNITGKQRVKRINQIQSTALRNVAVKLKPCAYYNYSSQKYQPALTLHIQF